MRKCSVKNCDRKYAQAGYCWKHYHQMRRYGRILERTIYDKNEYINLGDSTQVVLYNERCQEVARAVIDSEDKERVSCHKWGLSVSGYATSRKGSVTIHMHRLLNKTPKGYDTDHIDGNRLDNRKENLRTATRAENLRNKPGIRGVSFRADRNKWRARIHTDNGVLFLGYFRTKEQAIVARLDAEQKYFGEFSRNMSGSRPRE